MINELQDKKIAKVFVRRMQNFFKNWGSYSPTNISQKKLSLIELDGYETFFGYYDKNPFSSNMKYLLFYRSKYSTKKNPRKDVPIELVLFDFSEKIIIKTWCVWAYNWQQGSKVQWLNDDKFAFNNYDRNRGCYYSLIIDASTLLEERVNYPLYDGTLAYFLTLNFERLNKLRPDYGYRNRIGKYFSDKEDGVFIYNIKEQTFKLLISLDFLVGNFHKPSMDKANHKVNHIMISPLKDRFMFMHRWIKNGKKEDRLYVYQFESKKLDCVADYGMVSHCTWMDNNHILGYMNGPGNKAGYYLIDIDQMLLKRMSDKIQHLGDGHPSVLKNVMLFDSYPDENRLKHLYKYDILNDKLVDVGTLKEALGFECQCRCDLHPRFVCDNLISIDSTHLGKRTFCIIEI